MVDSSEGANQGLQVQESASRLRFYRLDVVGPEAVERIVAEVTAAR